MSLLRRRRRPGERAIEAALLLCAGSAVFVTAAILFVLVSESLMFFRHVPLAEFLGETRWTPLFQEPRYGIAPLLAGTLVSSVIALLLAVPVGTLVAVYLSEFAGPRLRELAKPALELLAGMPTVVFGYFALLFVTPLLQRFIPGLPGFNLLSAGLVIGILIVPYVSSLAEDALRAVPMELREASAALGAGRFHTAWHVVLPAAASGVVASFVLAAARALGETMVVAIAAGQQPNFGLDPREPGATLTTYIAQVALGDLPHGSIGFQSIYAAGLVLFLLTLAFNLAGHWLRRRWREAL